MLMGELGESSGPLEGIKDAFRQGNANLETTIHEFYKYVLFREPNPQELDIATSYFQDRDTEQGFQDLSWALINLPDFLYK